jgi:copper homeostasis protein CutC
MICFDWSERLTLIVQQSSERVELCTAPSTAHLTASRTQDGVRYAEGGLTLRTVSEHGSNVLARTD